MERAALYAHLDTYLAALGAKDIKALEWAPNVRNSENNVMLEPGDGLWGTIVRVGEYDLRFADETTNQVGYFGTVHETYEESAYTVRIRYDDQARISEVEAVVVRQSDSGIVFENQRFWDKPILNTNPEQRDTREEMIRLSNGYFDTLQLNDGTIHTKFHPDCNRVENGVQTTRNPEFAKIVPVSSLGCEEQFRMGNYRYDDRLRGRRFPLVDEERGLVLAFGFIDHCGVLDEYHLTDGRLIKSPIRRPHSFYLGELFKIDDGMIQQIGPISSQCPIIWPSPWDA